MTQTPKKERLRVWWIPQVPGNPFYVEVESIVEGKLLLEALAQYDIFQLENNIKPDYSNAGGLQVLENNEDNTSWIDWYEEETGESIDEYSLKELRKFCETENKD